ncbi:MAG: hypothetical protein CK425_02800 [Parachlamydia sp.]|nr:MAG: hypothetical protein CK425_02800 [Parachlamydia sp.]
MSITAISKFQQAEQFKIGTAKPVTVKNALKCVSSENAISKIWHKILCFLTGKGLITKDRLIKALHEADLPTLTKVQKLFDKAQKLAEGHTKETDAAKAAEKKAADQFLKQKDNNKLFLSLLQEEFLFKFAANDPAVLALCKGLPKASQEAILELSKEGITSTYIAAKHRKAEEPAAEVLKTLFAVDKFKEGIQTDINSLSAPKADAIPPMADLLKALKDGFQEIINNGCKLPKTASKEFVKTVTFKIGEQADKQNVETFLAAPKPASPEETAEIFKKSLAEKSSHIVALSYPDYLPLKADAEHKLGTSSISLKLLSQELINLDPNDLATTAIKKSIQVTDTSIKDKPLQRTIDFLIYPNWPATGTFKVDEMKAFIAHDKKVALGQEDEFKKNPLFIGSDALAHAGTYITMRQVQPNAAGDLPIVATYQHVSKFVGAAALPNTPEEMAAIFATFKSTLTPEELALLKPLKTDFTQEELAKELLAILSPGIEPTPVQIADTVNKLAYFGLNMPEASPAVLQSVSLLIKDMIFILSSEELAKQTAKAHGISDANTILKYPEVVAEIVVEYKKVRQEKAAALAKEIFKDLTGEALKAKEELLIQTISINEKFEEFKDPAFHESIKELSAQKISLFDLDLLEKEFTTPEFLGKLSDSFKSKNLPNLLALLKDDKAFKEYLTALLAAKAAKAAQV